MLAKLPEGTVLIAGRTLELLRMAVLDAARWRARNGLPALHAYAELLKLMSVDGPTDNDQEPAGQREAMTSEEVAALLGCSVRHVRRLAPALGGHKVGRTWILDRAAVIEHHEANE